MTPTEQAIDKLVDHLMQYSFDYGAKEIPMSEDPPILIARQAKAKLLSLLKEAEAKTAKAYGGCTNCYGKGYATVNDQWVGVDTDQDIGSPGGVVRGGNPTAMKFCACDRGKQLKQLQSKEVQG